MLTARSIGYVVVSSSNLMCLLIMLTCDSVGARGSVSIAFAISALYSLFSIVFTMGLFGFYMTHLEVLWFLTFAFNTCTANKYANDA